MSNDTDDVFLKPMTPIATTNRRLSQRKSPAIIPKREILNTTVTSTNYLTTKPSTSDNNKFIPRRSVSGFLLNTKQKELSPATMRRTSIGLPTSASQLKLTKSNTGILKRSKFQLQKPTNSPKCSPLMRTSTLTSISSPSAIKINTTLTLSDSGKSKLTPSGKKSPSSLTSSCSSLNPQTPKNRLLSSKNVTGSLSTGKKFKSGTGSSVSSSTKAR